MNRQERRKQEKIDRRDGRPTPKTRAKLRAAREAFEAGDFVNAEEGYLDILAGAPKNTEALHMVGLLYYRTNRLEDAAESMIKAALVDGRDADLHADLAGVLTLLGRGAEAEAAARHVLELRNPDARILNSLSVALELQGKVDEAAEASARAMELEPDHLEACINMGNMKFRAGDMIEAERLYRRACEIAPGRAMPHTNLAIVLRRMGELAAAEEAARAAIQIDGGYPQARDTLGTIMMEIGDYGAAIESFEAALSTHDGFSEARANLAAARFKVGDLPGAEKEYAKMCSARRPLAEAWSGLGMAQLAGGETDSAVESFRAAVEMKPGLGGAWVNLALAGAASAKDKTAIEEALKSDETTPDQMTQMRFALGMLADKAGDAADAFAHFEAGNALRRGQLAALGSTFDGKAHKARTDRILSAFKGAGGKLPKGGSASNVPVFVLGMPRSGATLVEQILAVHPEVRSAGEMDVLRAAFEDPAEVLTLDAEEISDVAEGYLERLTASRSAKRVIDKTPFNWEMLGVVAALLPKAKVIRVTRESEDVALSCFMTNFEAARPWSTRLEDIRAMQTSEKSLMTLWKEEGALDIIEVAYEDLLARPEAVGKRLIGFIGLDWDPACLRFHENAGAVLTASNWRVRQPLYQSAKGRSAAYAAYLNG